MFIKMCNIKSGMKVTLSFLLNLFNNYRIDTVLQDAKKMKKISKRYLRMLEIYPNLSPSLYLHNLSNSIKKNINDSIIGIDYLKKRLIEIFEASDDDSKMMMAQLFYLTDLIDNEISKLIIRFASETGNSNYRFWLTMDISKMTFRLQSGFYDDYYIDRRKLLQQVAEENNFIIPTVKNKTSSDTKLCIVTYLLDKSISNSAQRVAMMVANGMAERFDKVIIVTLDSFSPSKEERKDITTLFYRQLSSSMSESIRQMFDEKIEIHYAKGERFQERYQNSIDIIYDFNPDAIIDMSDEYSAISYFYNDDFLTYYLPMRNNASSLFFRIVGGKKWKYEAVNKKYRSVDISQVVDWTFPEYVPEKKGEFRREDLKIDSEAFVIVSIGNNSKGCDNYFIDEISELLKRNDNFVWLLIGEPAPDYLHHRYDSLIKEKKVIEYGYETNLYALCSICDLVLRPNITGGSGATAIGAMNGLPIAMTNFLCDPMRWLGEEYSRIRNYHELMEYIEELANNKELYNEQSKLTLEKVQAATDADKKWDELEDILKRESGMKN